MSTDSSNGILSYFEAEAYIKNLKCFDVSNVGNAEWMRQHEVCQVHECAHVSINVHNR
jgi:hypothetical protein